MGDLIDVDFRSRIIRSAEVGEEGLRTDFLNWLSRAPAYKALKALTISVDARDVNAFTEKMNANPEEYPTDVLIKNLIARKVNEYTAPEMLATIKVVKQRFGIKN